MVFSNGSEMDSQKFRTVAFFWFVETRRVPPPYLVTLARKNVSLLTNADLHMWLENSHTCCMPKVEEKGHCRHSCAQIGA